MLKYLRAALDKMLEERTALTTEVDSIVAKAESENRSALTTEETSTLDERAAAIKAKDAEIEAQRSRVKDAEEREARADIEAATRTQDDPTGAGEKRAAAKVTDPPMYVRGGKNGRSYFRDLAKSQLNNDRDAGERLGRHAKAAADKEARALGNTNATGGSGGEFAPPDWLVEDFVALTRPGRATGQLYKQMPVPPGVSSVQLPKILSGTTVALQSTQNTALSQTDLTTGSVGTGFSTIGGKQVVAQQLLDQSEIDFDKVVTDDLAAAYGLNYGTQIISGAGVGANNNSVVNGLANAVVPAGQQTVFTQASPTAAQFYSKAAGMLAAFATSRFAEPTVWLMHPRRWYWLLAQSDNSGRPLVVPDVELASGTVRATNPTAVNTDSPVAVVGAVGMFLGLPVVIDPLIPTTLGAGTNQDEIFLLKQDDLWGFESNPVAEVFRETYADSVGVLFRLYGYLGTILNRQLNSIATMNGTGLAAPSF